MKNCLGRLAAVFFLFGAFFFCLFMIHGDKSLVLRAQVSPQQKKEVFWEPIIFQGDDPLTKKLTSLVKKMRMAPYRQENGVHVSLTKEGGNLSFGEDTQNVYFSYEFGGSIISYEIPKYLTYASGTSQVLDEEVLPLASTELRVLVDQELID